MISRLEISNTTKINKTEQETKDKQYDNALAE
jgi:hypothetical protein